MRDEPTKPAAPRRYPFCPRFETDRGTASAMRYRRGDVDSHSVHQECPAERDTKTLMCQRDGCLTQRLSYETRIRGGARRIKTLMQALPTRNETHRMTRNHLVTPQENGLLVVLMHFALVD